MRKIIRLNLKKSDRRSFGLYFAVNGDLSSEVIAFFGSRSLGLKLFGKHEVVQEPVVPEKKKRTVKRTVTKKAAPKEALKEEAAPKEVKKRTYTRKKKDTPSSDS